MQLAVGINEAHQDPNVPVELDVRRNIVRKIATLLESRFYKEARLQFMKIPTITGSNLRLSYQAIGETGSRIITRRKHNFVIRISKIRELRILVINDPSTSLKAQGN